MKDISNNMNENTKQFDELLYFIPDYIRGKIDDEKLKQSIRDKIKNDIKFKKQFDDIQNTILFIDKAGFEQPPVEYFNNFIPRLNERIDKERNNFKFGLYIPLWLKYGVPVAALIIISFIFIFQKNTDQSLSLSSDTIDKIDTEYQKNNNIKNELTQDKFFDKVPDKIENSYINEKKVLSHKYYANSPSTVKEDMSTGYEIQDVINVSDLLDSYHQENDEFYYESEFSSMSSNEQNELIDNLKNAKF